MSYLDKSTPEDWDRVARQIKERQIEAVKARRELEEESSDIKDPINPSHYKGEGIECIDYIKERSSKEEFLGYLNGNLIKYVHRWKNKNGVEDLRKARWYIERLIKEVCL
jgi:hypothetical protein